MNKYLLFYISYDGHLFHGFAIQNGYKTIEEVIRSKLDHIFPDGFSLRFFSRTDRYVHSLEQILLVTLNDREIKLDKIKLSLNKLFNKEGINVSKIKYVVKPIKQKDIISRTYIFRFKNKPSIFERFYYTKTPVISDLGLLEKALQVFVGTHDFLYFSNEKENTIKTINFIKMTTTKKGLNIIFNGSGFLRFMIRRILCVSFSITNINELEKLKFCVLNKKNVYNMFKIITIDPYGLYLKRIHLNE